MNRQDNGWYAVSGRTCLSVSAILVGLFLIGCGESQLRTIPLTPSRTPVVQDLPMPMHFELVDKLSEDYAAPGWRLVRHSYFGEAAPHVVRDFYKEQMPTAGWQFVSDRNVQGAFHLLFEKGREMCEVQIAKHTRQFAAGALVTIIVKPVGSEDAGKE